MRNARALLFGCRLAGRLPVDGAHPGAVIPPEFASGRMASPRTAVDRLPLSHDRAWLRRMVEAEQVPQLVCEGGFKVVGTGLPVGRKLLSRVDDDVGLDDLARPTVEEELRVADATAGEEGVIFGRVRQGDEAHAVALRPGTRRLFVRPLNDEARAASALPARQRTAHGPLHVAARLDVRGRRPDGR